MKVYSGFKALMKDVKNKPKPKKGKKKIY